MGPKNCTPFYILTNFVKSAVAVERTQPTEIAPPTMSKYFEATSGIQPPISRKLAKKMRHFFASTIEESDVEQETATTTADIMSTNRANVAIVEQPLIEPVVSVAPPTSAHTHEYESADVSDEPVWVLRTTAPTASSSTPYVAHSTVLPRTALSAIQAKGTAPTAHPIPYGKPILASTACSGCCC